MTYISSYSSYTYQPAIQNSQIQQPQISNQELVAYHSELRAKRLGGLFEKLSDVIEVAANTSVTNPHIALQNQREYVEYVLARLRGDQNLETPESLGEFAYELESLIDDILQAWEALLEVNTFIEKDDFREVHSFDSIMAILARIASRRIENLMENNWIQQWWDIHRKRDEDHQATLKDSEVSVQANLNQGHPSNQLLELLSHVSEMTDPNGIYLISESKRKDIKNLLALLNTAQTQYH